MIRASIKYLLIIVLLMVYSSTAQAGFYVIPIVTEVEVEKEVCTGISVGAKAFQLTTGAQLYIGDIYQTTAGKLVKIVGIYDQVCYEHSLVRYSSLDFFYVSHCSVFPKGWMETVLIRKSAPGK